MSKNYSGWFEKKEDAKDNVSDFVNSIDSSIDDDIDSPKERSLLMELDNKIRFLKQTI